MNLTTSCSSDQPQSGQSPDSGIVIGAASFAGTDSSLSPCGTLDSATSTSGSSSASDMQMARKRSKSLPELESPEEAKVEGQAQQDQRPASVEGASKDLTSDEPSTSKSYSTSSKQRNTSTSQQQRNRLYSSPAPAPQGMHGTVPLSHTPTSLSKGSLNGPQFSVPKVNYSPLHHAGSHSSMYAGFPGYQPYNSTSPGMPTQAAYPPTYNPYTGSAATGSSYMGPSGHSGSALYNTNSLVHSPSYGSQSSMLNYMPYTTNMAADGKQQQQGSSLFSYNNSYPYSSNGSMSNMLSGGWGNSSSLGTYSSLATTTASGMELNHLSQPTSSTSSTSAIAQSVQSSSMALIETEHQQEQLNTSQAQVTSPQEIRSPLEGIVAGCDSTTTGTEVAGETMEVDANAGTEGAKSSVSEVQQYSTR